MDYQEDQLVEVNVVYLFQTEEAVKVEDLECKAVWIPKAAIKGDAEIEDWEEGVEITISIPESLATRKGLI
jgi:hypothetical protein